MNNRLIIINKKFTFSSQINYDLLKIVWYYIGRMNGGRTPFIPTVENISRHPPKTFSFLLSKAGQPLLTSGCFAFYLVLFICFSIFAFFNV